MQESPLFYSLVGIFTHLSHSNVWFIIGSRIKIGKRRWAAGGCCCRCWALAELPWAKYIVYVRIMECGYRRNVCRCHDWCAFLYPAAYVTVRIKMVDKWLQSFPKFNKASPNTNDSNNCNKFWNEQDKNKHNHLMQWQNEFVLFKRNQIQSIRWCLDACRFDGQWPVISTKWFERCYFDCQE